MHVGICKVCTESIPENKNANTTICSRKCRNKLARSKWRADNNLPSTKNTICMVCSEPFYADGRVDTKLCSTKCKNKKAAELARTRRNTSIESKIRAATATAISRARHKSKGSDITAEYIVNLMHSNGDKCSVTGIPFEETGAFIPSIDRVDSSKGYFKDNVQIVCWIYNRAKCDGTDDDVWRMIKGWTECKIKKIKELQ